MSAALPLDLEQLSAGIYRANPELAALPVNRLPPSLQTVAAGRAGTFGVQASRSKAVDDLMPLDKEAALVLLALAEAGPLPDFALPELLDRDGAWLKRLLLDHRIEIRLEDGFVGGPKLLDCLFPEDVIRPPTLSAQAIDHALSLGTDDADILTMVLYRYNSAPITPCWRQRLGESERIPAFLANGSNGSFERLLDGWQLSGGDDHWLHAKRVDGLSQSLDGISCKLYVSPQTAALPEVMSPILGALKDGGALAFKIGRTLTDLMRPDKLVAYFDSRDRLQQAADRLCSSLESCPVQGVPFAAVIDERGLLGWGIDPNEGQLSWRFWVCRSIADGLSKAIKAKLDEPRVLALSRLKEYDIDVATFRPGPGWKGWSS